MATLIRRTLLRTWAPIFRSLSRIVPQVAGFVVFDFAPGDFLSEVGAWIKDGRIRYREDIREGLENAPAAFTGLLEGENFGKLLVRVAPDPIS